MNGSFAENINMYPMRLYDAQCAGNEHKILHCPIQLTERGVSYEQCIHNKAIAICQCKYE